MSQAMSVTADNFEEEVVKSELPVLVDFWAERCIPCKQMSPVIDQIADEMDSKIKVYKCDCATNPSIASRYRIISIPTFILFKYGEVVERMVGVKRKDEMIKKINENV
jgi:thioredoxin 1